MEGQGEKLNVIIQFNDAEVFLVEEGTSVVIEKGLLSITEVPSHQGYAILVNNFHYLITSEIPIMARRMIDGETIYILPNVKGYYGIRLSSTANQENLELFELILHQLTEFMLETEHIPNAEPAPEEQATLGDHITPGEQEQPSQAKFVIKKAADYNPNLKQALKNSAKQEVHETQVEERPQIKKEKERVKTGAKVEAASQEEGVKKEDNTAKVSNAIVKGGQFVRTGLIKVAGVTSVGITKAGQYISRKFLKKKKDVEVKAATMGKIKIAKTTTNAVVVFTTAQVKALITAAGMVIKEVGSQFENGETGKKLQDKPAYHTAKQIGKSAIQAGASIYDGMYEALATLGRGIGGATTEIVQQKYGEQMGEATQGVIDGIGNVGKVWKVVPVETAKALAQTGEEKK